MGGSLPPGKARLPSKPLLDRDGIDQCVPRRGYRPQRLPGKVLARLPHWRQANAAKPAGLVRLARKRPMTLCTRTGPTTVRATSRHNAHAATLATGSASRLAILARRSRVSGAMPWRAKAVSPWPVIAARRGRAISARPSACPEKANDTSHQDQSASPDGYVAPQRTCRHVGDRQCIQVGDFGTAVAGERGHAMVGESGFALAGDRGTARAGDFGTAREWRGWPRTRAARAPVVTWRPRCWPCAP